MQTDFKADGDKLQLSSSSKPSVEYSGPSSATGSGTHRFVFLLYAQPSTFDSGSMKSVSQQGFNTADWKTANGLQAAEAGIHFVAAVSGGSSSSSGSMNSGMNMGSGNMMTMESTMTMASTMAMDTTMTMADTTMTMPAGMTMDTTMVMSSIMTVATSAVAAPPAAVSSAIAAPPAAVSSANVAPAESSAPAGATLSVAPPAGSGSVVGSAAGAAQTITVKVGGTAKIYTPNQVNANVGDTILFDFLQVNHTVSQSTLASPCKFMAGGSDSGFRPNPQGIEMTQTFTFAVNDTKPKWFYCKQTGHCAAGMVFAINPAGKFDQFLAAAKATGNGTNSTTTAPGAPAQQSSLGGAGRLGVSMGLVAGALGALVAAF